MTFRSIKKVPPLLARACDKNLAQCAVRHTVILENDSFGHRRPFAFSPWEPLHHAGFHRYDGRLLMRGCMKRRQFIALLGSAAAWPLACYAQQAPMPVIGFLSSRSPGESSAVVAAFRQGLSEAGYLVGKNVSIDYRWAEGQYDRLPALAAELISLRVAAILAAGGPPSALAAKAATSSIPIVFSAASDPVGLGLVASLNRPGGNLTGMSTLTTPLVAKGIELLKELLPAATVMAYLANPSNPSAGGEAALAAAQNLGIALHVLNASTDDELVTAFKTLTMLHADGLL